MGHPRKGKTDEELALAGIEALADFIQEVGLPTTLRAGGGESPAEGDRQFLRHLPGKL